MDGSKVLKFNKLDRRLRRRSSALSRRSASIGNPGITRARRRSSEDLDLELVVERPAAELLENLGGSKAFRVVVKGRAGAALAYQVAVRAAQARDDGVDFELLGGA